MSVSLKNFITETLISIAEGITDANHRYGTTPPFSLVGGAKGTIDFEIAIGVEESALRKADAGIGIPKVLVFEAKVGAAGERRKQDSSHNVIRFSIRASERTIFTPEE